MTKLVLVELIEFKNSQQNKGVMRSTYDLRMRWDNDYYHCYTFTEEDIRNPDHIGKALIELGHTVLKDPGLYNSEEGS